MLEKTEVIVPKSPKSKLEKNVDSGLDDTITSVFSNVGLGVDDTIISVFSNVSLGLDDTITSVFSNFDYRSNSVIKS
jgi:ribosomal protein L27